MRAMVRTNKPPSATSKGPSFMIAKLSAVFVLAVVASLAGCAGAANDDTQSTSDDLSSDKCVTPARNAAEAEYGNDPVRTKVTAVTKGKKYRVTVGIGNEEDGPEDFYVTFPSGCSSKPSVSDVPSIPNPLRDAAHTVYDKLLAGKMATRFPLPTRRRCPASLRRPRTRNTEKYKTEGARTAAHSYEVSVSGEKATYAVVCDVKDDSIIHDIAIYDSSGNDVDEASVYGTKDVGDNGVTWQNETFEEQD